MCLPQKVLNPDSVLDEGMFHGHEYIITSNNFGYRCGYVKVEKNHPLHGKSYDCRALEKISRKVHGGLTFSEADMQCDKDGDDSGWWFGFDCAHYSDAPDPALNRFVYKDILSMRQEEGYETLDWSKVRSEKYVRGDCKALCWSLSTVRTKENANPEDYPWQ